MAEDVIAGRAAIQSSNKEHDWLGSGAYFWEGSPHRAHEWAADMAAKPSTSPRRVQRPAVVGAVIDLGRCLNLFDSAALDELRAAWEVLRLTMREEGKPVPKNKGKAPDFLGRYRDRAVIQFLHTIRKAGGLPPYDTVRAAFPEGGRLYPGAGFTRRSHIQIAVINPQCIKAYFRPLTD